MKKITLALAILLAPAAVHADPVSLITLAAAVAAKIGIISVWTAFFVSAGVSVISSIEQRRQARRAAARERAQYNASLTDRSVSVLSSMPPWRYVYGRAVTGGEIHAIFTTDKTATAENGSTYTKPDCLKHLVIVFADRECAAINEIYIDGIAVGTLDANGFPTGGEFLRTRTASRTISFTGSITLAEPATSIVAAFSGIEGMDSYSPESVTASADGLTLTGPSGKSVICTYTVVPTVGSVRVQKHLGAPDQTADAYLMSVAPTKWTSAHRGRGKCYIVLTLDLELETRFQSGPPGVTADISGALLYDVRTGTTAYSTNNALAIADYLRSRIGLEVQSSELETAYFTAAANVCETPKPFLTIPDGGGLPGVTIAPTYTCNGVVTSDDAKEAVLSDLSESMAGSVMYGARWMVTAGQWTATVMDLTDDDLDGQIEIVQADTPVDQLFNSVKGSFIASGKASPSDINPYSNATFVSADGRELWEDVTLPFTNSLPRARNISRIKVETNRNGQIIRYPGKLHLWPLQIGDRVRVTSAEYGFSLKTYRVTDWQFTTRSAVVLTLQEDAADAWDDADAATADPTPNTDLPSPWQVAPLTGLTVTMDTAEILRPRMRVQWDRITDAYVGDGSGEVHVMWRSIGGTNWLAAGPVKGNETGVHFAPDGMAHGTQIVVMAWAVNALGSRSDARFAPGIVVLGGASLAGANLLPNSDMVAASPWVLESNPNSATIAAGPALASTIAPWMTTANYVLIGDVTHNAAVNQTGRVGSGLSDGNYPTTGTVIALDLKIPTRVAVTVGQRLCFSVYVAAHRCVAAPALYFINAAGAAVQGNLGAPSSPTGDVATNILGNYQRVSIIGTVPAGAVTALVVVRKYDTSAGNPASWLWWAAPQLEVMPAGATQPSPYSGGPVTGALAMLDSVGTGQIALNAATDVTTLAQSDLTFSGSSLTVTAAAFAVAFPEAGVYEITITATVIVTTNAANGSIRLSLSFSGAGAFSGDSNPEWQVLTASGSGARISVTHAVTLSLTGAGPWNINPYWARSSSANSYSIEHQWLRITRIKR